MPRDATERHDLEIDVAGAVPGLEPSRLRGWVQLPPPPLRGAARWLAWCLAGGRCTTGYFDLQVAGHNGYSMAAHLAAAGVVVAAVDHPGIGASGPAPDVFALTPTLVAGAHDAAVRHVRAGLADGTLLTGVAPLPHLQPVGVGHSMGGMLADVVQARHGTFVALAGFGHSGAGLPDQLTSAELALTGRPLDETEGRIVELARARFQEPTVDLPPTLGRVLPPGSFFAADVPDAVRAAFGAQSTRLLSTCGLTSMIPGSTDAEKATIGVPLLLALGDQDLVTDLPAAAARYPAVDDITLVRLRDTAHCHNQAGTRHQLWDRLLRWLG